MTCPANLMELFVTAQLQEEIEFHKRLMEDSKVYFTTDNTLSTYQIIIERNEN